LKSNSSPFIFSPVDIYIYSYITGSVISRLSGFPNA